MKFFLTGDSGFVGSALRSELLSAGHTVIGLRRRAAAASEGAYRAVIGDLREPAAWAGALEGVDAVLHLAASTGKADRAEHFSCIVDGTRRLLEACTAAGVRRILNVSTIAVTFPDKSRYWYAQAKSEAERLVAESGLDWVTVRPTIVAGPGSPVLEGLARLAALPMPVVFGKGSARVQPIDVQDLARSLAALAVQPVYGGRTIELGGPEVLTIEEFLGRIRQARKRKSANGRVMHVPLALLLPALRVVETVAYRAVPITVGQLATFRFDGVARPDGADGLPPPVTGIDAMLRRSLA